MGFLSNSPVLFCPRERKDYFLKMDSKGRRRGKSSGSLIFTVAKTIHHCNIIPAQHSPKYNVVPRHMEEEDILSLPICACATVEIDLMVQKSPLSLYISSTVFRTNGCHAIFSGQKLEWNGMEWNRLD